MAPTRKWGVEAIAQGDGAVLGREFEIADLLRYIKREDVSNTVWLTADVHYSAAHYYDPNKAVFQDFDPFWEFVSGPIQPAPSARTTLDNTFGPQLVYGNAPTQRAGPNLPPAAGMQFFGQVAIDGPSQQMTVSLKDLEDRALWAKTLEPKHG